jgi:hypothetical protein
VDNSTFAAEQNRTDSLCQSFFLFSQNTQAILRLIRTKGYILPDKKGYNIIIISVGLVPSFKKNRPNWSWNWGWGEGGEYWYWVLVLGTFN